jgi:hypothetical protein
MAATAAPPSSACLVLCRARLPKSPSKKAAHQTDAPVCRPNPINVLRLLRPSRAAGAPPS